MKNPKYILLSKNQLLRIIKNNMSESYLGKWLCWIQFGICMFATIYLLVINFYKDKKPLYPNEFDILNNNEF